MVVTKMRLVGKLESHQEDITVIKADKNKVVTSSQRGKPQLLKTKEVLHGHLMAKIKEVLPNAKVEQVSSAIIDFHNYSYIVKLLQCPELLSHEVHDVERTYEKAPEIKENEKISKEDSVCRTQTQQMETVSKDKMLLGEELFQRVADIESELCAQITGMLLEMDVDGIKQMLENDEVLEVAVLKSKTKYLTNHHPAMLPKREELGEELYETVRNLYPEDAAKITGMLLELDMCHLQQLLVDPAQLQFKAKQAFDTIVNHK